MFTDKVGRFLRLGDLADEDGDRKDNKRGKEKGGTTMTTPTAKNATGRDKNKSATTTASKKNKNMKKPRK